EQAYQLMQQEAVRRFEEWTDRAGFDLDTGIRVEVRETDDPDFPFDLVDGNEVIEAYDNREEAETAAVTLEDQHREQWHRAAIAEFYNQLNPQAFIDDVRRQLGLAEGVGILNGRIHFTGEALYERLSEESSPQEASDLLRSLGVNGIKYLDGG